MHIVPRIMLDNSDNVQAISHIMSGNIKNFVCLVSIDVGGVLEEGGCVC